MARRSVVKSLVALAALATIVVALWQLLSPMAALTITSTTVGRTPVTVYRLAAAPDGPVVVVAHGFAGSRQLMQAQAVALARNGFVAVTYDALGHGRQPDPLGGELTLETGATVHLVHQLDSIVDYARTLTPADDDRVALLGHSMAADIIIRQAVSDPDAYAATVAISMYSPAVTPDAPRNMLVIVGGLEPWVHHNEARRVASLPLDGVQAEPGVTYGDFADGSARQWRIAPGVEHIGVLYSKDAIMASVDWLNHAFGRTDATVDPPSARGSWILILLLAVVVLAWPASALLPRVADEPVGAALSWRRLRPLVIWPALLTPLILAPLPTDWLPVLVGDYLLLHFGLYGLLTGLGLWWWRRRWPSERPSAPVVARPGALVLATVMLLVYVMVGLGAPIELFVSSFIPTWERLLLVPVMMLGTLPFFMMDEWVTRGATRPRWGYAATSVAFMLSLVPAIILKLHDLFFLIILYPIIALYFVLFGLFSAWSWRQTHHPWVAAITSAFVFAWCVAVTFPITTGE
jgi:dienelactone hydrolase